MSLQPATVSLPALPAHQCNLGFEHSRDGICTLHAGGRISGPQPDDQPSNAAVPAAVAKQLHAASKSKSKALDAKPMQVQTTECPFHSSTGQQANMQSQPLSVQGSNMQRMQAPQQMPQQNQPAQQQNQQLTVQHQQRLHSPKQQQKQQQHVLPAQLLQQPLQHKHKQQQQQASQRFTVPSDLEVMDLLLDELVMKDPKISKVLGKGPAIVYETFTSQPDCSAAAAIAASQQAGDSGNQGMQGTFLTACRIPDSTAVLNKQRKQRLALPELVRSADLLTWNRNQQHSRAMQSVQQSVSATAHQSCNIMAVGRHAEQAAAARGGSPVSSPQVTTPRGQLLHRPRNSIAVMQLDSGSAVEQPRNSRQHIRGPVVAASQQLQMMQPVPTIDDLQYQMQQMRQLHLAGVNANRAAGGRVGLQDTTSSAAAASNLQQAVRHPSSVNMRAAALSWTRR